MSDVFLAKITKGEIDLGSPFNWARFHEFKKLNEGKYIRIERPKRIRSLKSNALYWVFLELIEHETGNDKMDLHFFFSKKFLPNKIIKIHGKKNDYDFERVTSTRELSSGEFTDYMTKISALTSVAIPDSQEYLLSKGYIPNDLPMR